jgi:glycosyltransferase involved in cell wall biosynthesis
MKILLLGEYSHLHNTLKQGLIALNHEVVLAGDGDGFKNFPVDISIRPIISNKPVIKWVKAGLFKLTGFDLTALERGVRFWFQSKHFKGFDVVQLINEKPVKTLPFLERLLLKKLFRNNNKVFLLSCGVDYISVQFMMNKKFRYSLMDPYFADSTLKKHYQYILDYTSKSHQKTHRLVFENCNGVIASDFDYVLPLEGHPKFLGLIPNPVKLDELGHKPMAITNKINILLGINSGTSIKKGIPFFEKAVQIIKEKYPDKVEVTVVENLPYTEYIKHYDKSHILLDQVYAYDQGYNALEAMARGKVVFTGAEKEFLQHYNLKEDEVCINALPDVDALVEKLSWLIENPEEIKRIGENARSFIVQEHHYVKIAKCYLETWKKANN